MVESNSVEEEKNDFKSEDWEKRIAKYDKCRIFSMIDYF